MLGWLFGREAEVRSLNRDAVSIVESTKVGYRASTQAEMALATRRGLREAHERGGPEPRGYKPILDHFKNQHREARRANDQVRLTACTLCIIYLRAEQIGAETRPARDAIDAFLGAWEHVQEDAVDA